MPTSSEVEFYKKFGPDLTTNTDPTVPYDNYFFLLGIPETREDQEVIVEAPQACRDRHQKAQQYAHRWGELVSEMQSSLAKGKHALTDANRLIAHRKKLWDDRFSKLQEEGEKYVGAGLPRGMAEPLLQKEAGELGFPTPLEIQDAVYRVLDDLWPPADESSVTVGPSVTVGDKWRALRVPLIATIAVFLVLILIGRDHPNIAAALGLILAALAGWLIYSERRWRHTFWGAACLIGALTAQMIGNRGGTPCSAEWIALDDIALPSDVPVRMAVATPAGVRVCGNSMPERNSASAPERAVDGERSSAWAAHGDGERTWLELTFGSSVPIDGIAVSNGPPGCLAAEGGRLGKARLELDDGPPIEIEFKDSSGWQIERFEPRVTSTIRVKKISAHFDDRSRTACIGEVWFYGSDRDPPDVDWAGSWVSDLGLLTLTQEAHWVTGSFGGNGKIVGRALGETLLGIWSNGPSHEPPSYAGEIRFEISNDGSSFTGRWRNGYGSDGEGSPWSGERESLE